MTQSRSSLISLVGSILHISCILAIDVFAYLIMSNRYHLVLQTKEAEIEACWDESILFGGIHYILGPSYILIYECLAKHGKSKRAEHMS